MQSFHYSALVALLAAVLFVGCETKNADDKNGKAKNESAKANDHPAHGPHGGHPFSFDGTDEMFGESTISKTGGVIRIYLLAENSEKSKPKLIKADKVTIKTTLPLDATYELKPIEPNENGEASAFMSDDKELKQAMERAPKLTIVAGDKTYTATIPGGHH